MSIANRGCFAVGRLVALGIVAVCLATPASAQFGGLKKKLKGEAAAKATEKAGGEAGAEAPAGPAAATSPAATPAKASAGGDVLLQRNRAAGRARRDLLRDVHEIGVPIHAVAHRRDYARRGS